MHRYVVSTTANGLCQGTCAAFIQPVWAHRSPLEDFEIPRRPQARASQHDSVRTTKACNLNRIVSTQKQYIPYYPGAKFDSRHDVTLRAVPAGDGDNCQPGMVARSPSRIVGAACRQQKPHETGFIDWRRRCLAGAWSKEQGRLEQTSGRNTLEKSSVSGTTLGRCAAWVTAM